MAYKITARMAGSLLRRRKDLSAAGVYRLRASRMEIAVNTLIAKSIFAAAAAVTFLGCTMSAGHAAGWRHEPWCAFFEYDDVTVDCSYRTFEECYPNVIGGIRGTCGPNPDGPGVSAAAPAEAHKQHKHRAQQ
jgi:hypothetical protein